MSKGEGFFCSFLEETQSRISLEAYKGKLEDFTKLITEIINSIIARTCSPQNEYYRIDAVGWTSYSEDKKIKDEAERVGLNSHIWDLDIAVEHENNVRDWTDELIKLIHVRSPLKVIIAYNYYDIRFDANNPESDASKLTYAAKWMKKIRAFNRDDGEEYLIILGNAAGKKDHHSSYNSFDYRGYLYSYESGEFVEINEGNGYERST